MQSELMMSLLELRPIRELQATSYSLSFASTKNFANNSAVPNAASTATFPQQHHPYLVEDNWYRQQDNHMWRTMTIREDTPAAGGSDAASFGLSLFVCGTNKSGLQQEKGLDTYTPEAQSATNTTSSVGVLPMLLQSLLRCQERKAEISPLTYSDDANTADDRGKQLSLTGIDRIIDMPPHNRPVFSPADPVALDSQQDALAEDALLMKRPDQHSEVLHDCGCHSAGETHFGLCR